MVKSYRGTLGYILYSTEFWEMELCNPILTSLSHKEGIFDDVAGHLAFLKS